MPRQELAARRRLPARGGRTGTGRNRPAPPALQRSWWQM